MMSDKSKATGSGDKGCNASITKKADRGHSTRLNSNLRVKDAKVNKEAEAQETNPFHVLQMEEDEESEDEKSEEIKDMQTLPAHPAPRTPQ